MIRLSNRDLLFLKDLYNIKYINSYRISKLYGNYNYGMKRISLLKKNKYIRLVDHLENGENVYCVSKKTCDMLLLPFISITKTDKLKHALACTDLYFYLLQNNIKINSFEVENQYQFKYQNKKYVFRPDITITTERPILVEIDLSNRRFKEKIEKWESFYSSLQYIKHFSKFPPILIVSTNPNKIMHEIEKYKKINLNYVYKKYENIKKWNYQYKNNT